MKKIINDLKEIGYLLNDKRPNSYIDIYCEKEFSSIGYLLDKDGYLYKYTEILGFNKETHNFSYQNELRKSSKKIDIDKLLEYLFNKVDIMSEKYINNYTEDEKYCEIIRTEKYRQEINNKELFYLLEKELLKLERQGEK